jgi:hypothetical protein
MTTTTVTAAPASADRSAGRRPGLRRRLAALVAGASVMLGVFAAATAPAGAATAGSPVAQACFQASTTMYGKTYWGPYDRPVIIDAVVGGQAFQMGTILPNRNGCVSQPLVAGYSWRFRVYQKASGSYWLGQTGWQYMVDGYTYNFGTVWLQSTPALF